MHKTLSKWWSVKQKYTTPASGYCLQASTLISWRGSIRKEVKKIFPWHNWRGTAWRHAIATVNCDVQSRTPEEGRLLFRPWASDHRNSRGSETKEIKGLLSPLLWRVSLLSSGRSAMKESEIGHHGPYPNSVHTHWALTAIPVSSRCTRAD